MFFFHGIKASIKIILQLVVKVLFAKIHKGNRMLSRFKKAKFRKVFRTKKLFRFSESVDLLITALQWLLW